MTDLTPLLSSLLQKHNCHLNPPPRTRSSTTDEFLKEAYRINTHILSLRTYLRHIRTPYLSNAPPPSQHHHHHHQTRPLAPKTPQQQTQHLTPPQRAAIDASAQSLLRDLNASIHQLADAEALRHSTALTLLRKKYRRGALAGALGRWAAGDGGDEGKGEEEKEEEGREEATALWRESVVWYLRRALGEVGEVWRAMVARRVEREGERGRSVLYLAKSQAAAAAAATEEAGGGGGGVGMNGGVDGGAAGGEKARSGGGGVAQLSEEQLQVFAQENHELLRHYEDTLDQVRTAEKSLLSISELQTTLAATLDTQSSQISQLVADAGSTAENVGGGNRQLKRAVERKSVARMVFWATVGVCSGLVVWDLVF